MKIARRSILFVPASEERYVAKAERMDSLDCVILDLEDGVSPNKKDLARSRLPESVAKLHKAGKEVLIRINDLSSCQGIEDLLFAAECGMEAILLPKIRSAALVMADQLLGAVEKKRSLGRNALRVLLMIETAASLQQMERLFAATERIDGLVFGAEDYSNDLGLPKENADASIRYAQAAIVNAAKAHAVDAIDSPCTDFLHPEVYQTEIKRARDLGFSGKTTIHPGMVDEINRWFVPSQMEMEYAREVLREYETGLRAGKGAISFRGQMVDKPVAERARKVLAQGTRK